MKRVLPVILVCIIFLSGCTGKNMESPSPSVTPQSQASSASNYEINMPAGDTTNEFETLSVDEWAEQNGIVLPEAGKADVFVSFDFTDSKLRASYVFNFLVSENAVITKADAAGGAECIRKGTWNANRFNRNIRKYEITFGSSVSAAVIEYTNTVDNNSADWCNLIEEKGIALNMYSSWAITDTSVPIEFTFHMEGLEDYTVLKSDYDPETKIWTYRDGYDFANLIAFKNGSYKKTSSGTFNFYTFNDADFDGYANLFSSGYNPIISYYSTIFFEKVTINNLDFVALNLGHGYGGSDWQSLYARRDLVVVDNLLPLKPDDNTDSWVSTFAHELGHSWFSGADTNTWEDWLNETGAEWASLLYMHSAGKDDYFEKTVNYSLNYLANALRDSNPVGPIKNMDPGDTHFMGTYMFSELYASRGLDTMVEVMRTLADVMAENDPTTEKFLTALRVKMGNDIPDRIEKGLTLTDYTGLFD